MKDIRGSIHRPAGWLLPTGLVIGVLILYGFFPTANAYYTRDPIDIAIRLNQNNWTALFDPHHLLYGPLVIAANRLALTLGLHNPLAVNQALSILTGALGLGFLFAFLRSLTGENWVAVISALFVAFCYGYWRYSVEAMPYSPMFLCLSAAAWAMERALRRGTWRHVALFAAASALAVLFHQSLLLLLPACLGVVVLSPAWKASRVRTLVVFLGAWTLLIIPAYGFAALTMHQVDSVGGLWLFLTQRLQAYGPALGLGQFSFTRSLKAVFGLGNLLLGEVFALRFVAARPQWAARLARLTPAVVLPPASYAASSPWQFVATLAMLAPLAALLALGTLYALRHIRRLWAGNRRILTVLMLWTVPTAAFAIWYFPENVHFWTPLLIPLGAVVALLLKDAQAYVPHRRLLLLGTLAVALLFGVNFVGSILPAHDPASNWNRAAALFIAQHTEPADLIISLEAGEYKHLPPNTTYYAGNLVFTVRGVFFAPEEEPALRRHVEDTVAQGHSVYLFGDVFESRTGHIGIARLSGLTEDEVRERLQGLFAACSLALVADHPRHPPLYRVTGCDFTTAGISWLCRLRD